MFRKLTLCLALALSAVALPAMAGEPNAPHKAQHAAATFPMPAAEFRTRIDARLAKQRARVEKHIAKKGTSPADAEKARAKLNEHVARIERLVVKVTEDGTVTKEEAHEVHEAMRAAFPHAHKQTAKHDKKRLNEASQRGRVPALARCASASRR